MGNEVESSLRLFFFNEILGIYYLIDARKSPVGESHLIGIILSRILGLVTVSVE